MNAAMTVPLLARDFPDPHWLRAGDGLAYLYGTNTNGWHVQVARVDVRGRVEHLGDALPVLPDWVKPGWTWAAKVVMRDEWQYRMYVSACHRDTGQQAIGVALSDRPHGPFVLDDRPLLVGFIDAEVARVDGQDILFYAGCGSDTGGAIYGQRLTPDGSSLWGVQVQVLAVTRGAERGVVEAPCYVHHAGRHYLLYSVAPFDTPQYAVHYAYSDTDALGPYVKPSDNVVLSGPTGPGHCDVLSNASGSLAILWHEWADKAEVGYEMGGYRVVYDGTLVFDQGRPRIVRGGTER